MIDTRLCKNEEELKLAMEYERDRALLSKHTDELFNLKMQRQHLDFRIFQKETTIASLERSVKKFKEQYEYMIVREGGDDIYLTTRS